VTTPGKKFGANAEGNSLHEAVDSVKDLVSRKISSYKDKKQNLFKRGGAKIKEFLRAGKIIG
ncbi:MAG: hypothetical protein KKC20_24610, partial [Proteobacteria bacterium]|nr:hypothetical protein [Pseudomonadota bacterium]